MYEILKELIKFIVISELYLEAGEMAVWAKCLLLKHEDLSLDP